ncbi:hypothetical protein KOW79_000587 [Hemibagrus wyckioides]|uniref:Uncharacterized protein n=1 Tax=Hemibagrus wyckioides TaxID=337641 RepID=A0A9D3P9B9_9TELE|nr:hypothetical protein KOW79_000587 [Hemibagrus wyckioides]
MEPLSGTDGLCTRVDPSLCKHCSVALSSACCFSPVQGPPSSISRFFPHRILFISGYYPSAPSSISGPERSRMGSVSVCCQWDWCGGQHSPQPSSSCCPQGQSQQPGLSDIFTGNRRAVGVESESLHGCRVLDN